jgi:hypothetical protein
MKTPPPRGVFIFASDREGILSEAIAAAASVRLLSFERNVNDAGSHHAEGTRGANGQINDTALRKRATVVDAALNRMALVIHGHDASHRPCSMSASHSMTSTTIVGRQARLGLSGGDEEDEGKSGNQ